MGKLVSTMAVILAASAYAFAASGNDPTDRAAKLAQEGKVDQAIALLEAELGHADSPDRVLAIRGMLGDLYSRKLDVNKAVAQYDLILKEHPTLALAHFRKAAALKQRADVASLEAAIREFQESRRLGYASPDVFSSIGFCYKCMADLALVSGKRREECLRLAEENLRRALVLDPKNHQAMYHLGDLEFNAGHYKEALAMYRVMSALAPNDPDPLAKMGHALLQSGNAQGALAPLEKAVALIAARQRLPDAETDIPFLQTRVECRFYRAEVFRPSLASRSPPASTSLFWT